MKAFFAVLLLMLPAGIGAAQSGGTFQVTQSVIAGGGGDASGGTFQLTGTIGQPIAGQTASGSPFSVQAGFWSVAVAATPTAATVGVSGRVLDAGGNPLRGVLLTMKDSSGGLIVTRSNAFGYFSFEEVRAGQSYLVELTAKDRQFAPQVVTVQDSLVGLEFRSLD